MEADARALDQRRVEAEICVVGAGPAGLALAHAFVGHAARVVVLESGGRAAEAAARELNAGAVSGDPRAGPAETRHRQLGGTPNVWNTWLGAERVARYAPLDPLDLEPRPELGSPGWPLAPGALAPWFAAAQGLCGLGPDTYRAADWSAPDARPFATRPGGLESG
ncbi:MAG TPA: hypothetical protein VGU27_01335, partial [Candidatus Eisenbacteria bacterium]|nr:hypothetical protein [Candidatus Eisenbacteria bacterium]